MRVATKEQLSSEIAEKVYLIYRDSPDDCAEIRGYILGIEADAEAYCAGLNKDASYNWDTYSYEELKKLN